MNLHVSECGGPCSPLSSQELLVPAADHPRYQIHNEEGKTKFDQILYILKQACSSYKDYDIYITGHSLGTYM